MLTANGQLLSLGAASYAVAINRLFYRIRAEDGDDVPIDRPVESP